MSMKILTTTCKNLPLLKISIHETNKVFERILQVLDVILQESCKIPIRRFLKIFINKILKRILTKFLTWFPPGFTSLTWGLDLLLDEEEEQEDKEEASIKP